MLPAPLAVHVPPPAPTHVQVAVSAAGNVSATVAPGAFDGPALDAVIVYVTLPPGVAVVTPSVFEIAKSTVETWAPATAAESICAANNTRSPVRARRQRDLRDDMVARAYSTGRGQSNPAPRLPRAVRHLQAVEVERVVIGDQPDQLVQRLADAVTAGLHAQQDRLIRG